MRSSSVAAALVLALGTNNLLASTIYDLNFTPPEFGSYTIYSGNPYVAPSIGPFTDALVFRATNSIPGISDQIRLPLGNVGQGVIVSFDVMAHSLRGSKYRFSMFLDTPEVRSVSLNGLSNNAQAFQPFAPINLFEFADDQVYHFEISVDLATALWSVSVDGHKWFTRDFAASTLQSIRFSTDKASGVAVPNAETYAALDNILVTTIPEPNTLAFLGLGSLVFMMRSRRRAG